MARDPRFQALKEYYKSKHYNDDHLAQALQLCRERRGYSDDWYPETPAQKGVFTRFMNHELVLAKLSDTDSKLGLDDVYNLYTTLYTLYSPEQLESRVGMIARDFRELVDRLEANDTTNRSRQELIVAQGDGKRNGFSVLMGQVMDIYEKKYTDVDAIMEAFDRKRPFATPEEREIARKKFEYRAQEYKTILANKERLAALAATKIGEDEGFIVNIRDFQVSFDEYNEDAELNDWSEGGAENNGEDREEGSKGDRYGDFRTLKLMSTLSVRAKKLLSHIPKVNSNGEKIRDDLGVTQFVGGRQAAVVLKKVLVNSSPDTMMDDLRAASSMYPWLRGLIDELQRNPDSQATVYNNFKNAESTYVYVNLDEGKYRPHVANSRASGNALMREAGNNLRAGYVLEESKSIYTGFGSLRSLDSIKKTHSEFNEVKKLVQSNYGTKWINLVEGSTKSSKSISDAIKEASDNGIDAAYLNEEPSEAMRKFFTSNPGLSEKLAGYLRGFGFVVSAKDIETIASQSMNRKAFGFIAGFSRSNTSVGQNKLYQLVDFIDSVYTRAEKIQDEKKNNGTGQYLYNTSDAFRKINSCLALAQYNEVEARVVNEGKSLSAYNNVNLLHQTLDDLCNKDHRTEEQYQKDLENNFLQYEGMAIGDKEHRLVHGWLQKFRDNEDGMRDRFRVVDSTGFNHVEYAQLSREQKLTNSLVMYFEGSRMLQSDKFALYEVPIQADYSTAYNFVFAPKINATELDKDSEIVTALAVEVLNEIERINAIQERSENKHRAILGVYEKQGLKFQIFPAFNDSGFLKEYKSQPNSDAAENYVREQVLAQLNDIVAKDFKTIEDSGVLSNKALNNIDFGRGVYKSLYSEDGKIERLSGEAQGKLREYCLNVFYARQQMVKIVTGGLEQFNGLIDFEKRNMLSHATRTSLYTRATWKGKMVGKETQNVVYIEDDESASAFLSDIKEMLQNLLDEKIISKNQFDSMIEAYSDIKTTDGQGFRTLESYRTVQIMADQWDDRHESAYNNIMSGHPNSGDIEVFMQNIKPVLTGYETIPAAAGENQKPVKLTVLHKYSETVLLPMTLSKYCLQTKSVPLQALERAQERLKNVDMFLFHSGVKVGAFSVVQPFAKDDDGNRILKDEKAIENHIVERVEANPFTVHTLPFKYYGIAASTPAHAADDKIAWASQAEKVAWANVRKGDKILVRGVEKDASEERELYNELKTANIVEEYKKLRETFVNSDELERIFQEELATKSYSSKELSYALAHLKNGEFALPLYSPNIEHQVQELLASIIKKRLTKPRVKGANILQSTGLGMDIEASSFDNTNALSEQDKLSVVFDGKGENKRIKYVEVFLPLHDSRLKEFADDNGNIGPDRLRRLVANGTIPEEILNFIAYRTPSDAEHSVIPCRIKGFVANTGGATIKMPKEIMVMTGHDYDGDKMRCHFPDFKVTWNRDQIEELYNDYLSELKPGEEIPYQLKSFDAFFKWYTSDKNQHLEQQAYRKVEYIAYDYNKSALENSRVARDNARIELMFAQLTSPAGSRRMLIPGGCDETKIIAKSLYLVRAARDEDARKKIAQKLNVDSADAISKNSSALYEALVRKTDKELTGIIREVSSLEMPYTLTHSADAFDYIMGGSEMIGIYALYNSALQMMQRLDMNYVPALTKNGQPYNVTILGNNWGKLFEVENHRGRLASLGLARLLNAAVDNNKDPVLGYLNQTKEMAEMTFLMFAAGQTEEDIHLIMNQPAVIKLIERLKTRDNNGLRAEALDIVADLAQNNQSLEVLASPTNQKSGLDNVSKLSREDFTANLSKTYEEIKNGSDANAIENQISILQTLVHLNTAASNLATFVRLTRPESESGSIGTTVADIIAKVAEINKFRAQLDNQEDSELRISGMRDVLKRRDVHEGWDTSYIEEVIGSNLPEVVALNSLMIDSSLDMFRPLFPQAKQSWVDLQAEIANAYSYKSIQEGTVRKIGEEMILYKLLANKKFVPGDPQAEQKRIIIDVPKYVKDLIQRINREETNPGSDPAVADLVGNAFLKNMTSTDPDSSGVAPRLRFSMNGPAIEGSADLIRASWGAMLNNDTVIGEYTDEAGKRRNETVRDLAIDLFKYNLYTNGFSYGMYEFAHLAPFSVLVQTPGYINALQDVLKSDWNDDAERENFIHYYYMNHWGNKKFVPKFNVSELNFVRRPDGVVGQLWIGKNNDEKLLDRIQGLRYIVLASGENGSTQDLYRIEKGNADAAIVLVKAPKLGVRNRSGQVTLQYNPSVTYLFAEPVVPGNDSAWGQLDNLNVYAEGNIGADGMITDPNYINSLAGLKSGKPQLLGLSFFGLAPAAEQMQNFEEKAEIAVEKNEAPLQKSPAPTLEDEMIPTGEGFFGLGSVGVDMAALQGAIVGTSSEDNDARLGNQMFSIARRSEDGEVYTETVPGTPANIRLARKQRTYIELNKKLREILRSKGVSVGVLTNMEARMSLAGVTDFDTANVTAEGFLEMIRIANGFQGEEALPEEFAHMALEMLGHDNILVSRLLSALHGSRESLQEAYDGMYDEYEKRYGSENVDKLVLEGAGKLVAKKLLYEQEIKSHPVKRLVHRVVDAIKGLLRRFSRDEVQNAIFDANEIASKIAREMLGGRLVDQMSLQNIEANGQLLAAAKKDLSNKNDILSKLLKIELKKLSIFKKRLAYKNKKQTSKSITAVEAEISKLEAAIKNYKTEDAVITYLHDSLDFLAATKKSLDDAVESGRSVNSICQKLNRVRDTLYGTSAAIQDIREAINNKEIEDSVGLTSAMAQVGEVLERFFVDYNRLARTYFEEMLSSVYGEHGKTVDAGREKGRRISIHEMATRADRDISLASRWFNSLADCNDFVLKAIDDVVRDAKNRSRRRAAAVRPRIEAAIAELEKSTGSRDQSFMFEMIRKDDGKMHKTGKYISEIASRKLSPAQKKFYDEMMAIKKEADACVPESLVEERKIVMLRKYTMDRFKDAEGAKGKALEAWEGLKNRVMDTSDDIDYENFEVAKDFEGNRVDMLPVKYLLKGKKESYDDMTDDVATSLMSYAGMAFEYNELNSVIGILENAKYMASQRDIVQRTGSRTQRESIETDNYVFREPFTVKQARSRAQEALEDFFQMHVYGHIRAEEGTFGKTRVSKRKVVDTVNSVVSLSQMAINIPQRIANVSTGLTQIVIESAGKGEFNAKDVAWASKIYGLQSGDRVAQTGKTDFDNKLSLWDEYFDVHQDNGRNENKYKKGRMSRIFNGNLLYAGLAMGEDYLSTVTSLAAARNFKVKDANGKATNLWEAYEVKYVNPTDKTGAYLALKPGFTKMDGSPITYEDENQFAKKVAGMNFELQGIYNLDDRSAVQQYAFGALIIMYRKWIAPAMKRRYGRAQYSTLKDSYEEGYHNTLGRFLWDTIRDAKDQVTEGESATTMLNIIADVKAVLSSWKLNYSKMNAYEKSNIHRALTELSIVFGLWVSTALLTKLPPPDEDDDRSKFLTWWDNTVTSQLLRLRTEIGSQAPTPMLVDEALKILKSPFAAIGPIQDSLNMFQLLLPSNYWTEIKNGRYSGHTKAYKYFREMPIISMFKKVDNFLDPSPLIQFYQTGF